MGGGVVWIPEMAQVLGVPRFRDKGGYGKIPKVCISRMTNIRTIVDFARKKSKAASKKDKQREQLVEALACPISHLGMIKFWAIHSQTIEAYTL
jgi:hypothetical protein